MRVLSILILMLMPPLASAELVIDDAWIQNLPPSVPVRAGYLTIANPDSGPVTIVGLQGDAFARIEIHRSVMENGTMRMEPLPRLEIPAGETMSFEPGGLHLMMHPRQPTRPGERYRIVIEFEDGTRRDLDMTVRK